MSDPTNPYAPPTADLAIPPPALEGGLFERLRVMSTWRLFFFGLLTYTVYWAHHIKRQSDVVNESLPDHERISQALIWAVVVTSYAGLAALLYGFVEESAPVAALSKGIDQVGNLLLLVWAFKMRSRIHRLAGASKGGPTWFHGGWTFFLTVIYLNYRVNVIREREQAR